MEFRHPIPVRFDDIDQAGIVYYPNFFHYYHVAFEEFFGPTTGQPYSHWIRERNLGFPTVHVESDFVAPVRYGDPVTIAVTVPDVGRSSIHFRFLALGDHDRVLGRADVTKVCVEMDSLRPCQVPDDLREVLARFVEGTGATPSH